MAYMKRFSGMVEAAAGGADHLGIWFNSRPKTNLHVEKRFLRHTEIEALPTGGWGYAYFPYVARFVRPLGCRPSATPAASSRAGRQRRAEAARGAEVRVLPDPEPGNDSGVETCSTRAASPTAPSMT